MFRKALLISAAMLLLALQRADAASVPMTMSCGNMSPADCKKDMMMKMDKEVLMMFTEMMKTQMTRRMDIYAAVKNEMPEDSMYIKVLMQAIDDMKKQMPTLQKMEGMNTEEMGHALDNVLMSMQPVFDEAEKQESTNAEKFKVSMDKHYNKDTMEEGLRIMLKKFEAVCMDMLNGLREEDTKEYPQYTEMKEMMKTMMETTNFSKRMNMITHMIKKMMDFHETPHMMAILNMLTNGCRKCPNF